jgi:hypothetical protein
MDDFWKQRLQKDGTISCPGCDKFMQIKLSKSEKNPGRSFVSCDAREGRDGCGLFCFVDEAPKKQFGNRAQKRERPSDNAHDMTIVANKHVPSELEVKLDALSAKVDTVLEKLAILLDQ